MRTLQMRVRRHQRHHQAGASRQGSVPSHISFTIEYYIICHVTFGSGNRRTFHDDHNHHLQIEEAHMELLLSWHHGMKLLKVTSAKR
jgi:hypothetical protein